VFPVLRHLRVENPMAMNELSWDALQSFTTPRAFSGRPVQVNLPLHLCDICHAGFREQQGLERHLVDKHAYRIVCSYCGDFEWSPGYSRLLFRDHLEIKHPEVAALISGSVSYASELREPVNRHSSMRAPDIATSSTMVTMPHSQ